MPAPGSPQASALAYVAARSRGGPLPAPVPVTLNFHPDRLHGDLPILHAMALDGYYRSQFETGTSNGGLSAWPGGDRYNWESHLFGGVYDHLPPDARPKYGALNHHDHATGGAPRFGSAHLRLRDEVLARCTFCYPDSVFAPMHFGVAARMAILAHAQAALPDPLDDYIEAHVHGPVSLSEDVDALVLDPVYRGSAIEEQARRLPCPIEWHPGFRLSVDELAAHPAYRGPDYVALGRALARDGFLDPACIGAAAATRRHARQDLKKVWHYLARYGDASR